MRRPIRRIESICLRSTLERLTMESNDDAQAMMGFELPTSNMGENPFDVFKKFYRIYPHFSRVEL